MSKNGSITSFFKPVAPSFQSSQTGSQPAPSDKSQSTCTPTSARVTSDIAPVFLPPPASSPPPLSSSPAPTKGLEEAVPSRSRDDVIPGSDDDDDDDDDDDGSSGDELPDLLSAHREKPVPVPATLRTNPAKRTAVAKVSSQITPRTSHEFDMKALVENSEMVAMQEARAQQIASFDLRSDFSDSDFSDSDFSFTSNPVRLWKTPKATIVNDPALDVLPNVGSDEAKDMKHDRLRRAVQRTEATSIRLEWHFFSRDAEHSDSITAQSRFPDDAATEEWSFLKDPTTRTAYFMEGIVSDAQLDCHMFLPDAIFFWLLDQVTGEDCPKLRERYVRVIGNCWTLVTLYLKNATLDKLFRAVGASSKATDTSKLVIGTPVINSHCQRRHDWAKLQSVLGLVAIASYAMCTSALVHCTVLLVQLSMDRLVKENVCVHADCVMAFCRIAEAVEPICWDYYCDSVCALLHRTVENIGFRWDALSCIPTMSPRLVDLRRRLAIVLVFEDRRRGYFKPENSISLRAVIGKLKHGKAFVIDRNTNYVELKALIGMLSIAIDDGDPPASSDGDPPASCECARQFDSEVDELAEHIRRMWNAIPDPGSQHVTRMEARSALQDLEKTLLYTIRTQPSRKRRMFADAHDQEAEDLSRGQGFMKRFLKRGGESSLE